MRIAVALLGAALVAGAIVLASAAEAKCPPGTAYQCHQGWNGKVVCGCR